MSWPWWMWPRGRRRSGRPRRRTSTRLRPGTRPPPCGAGRRRGRRRRTSTSSRSRPEASPCGAARGRPVDAPAARPCSRGRELAARGVQRCTSRARCGSAQPEPHGGGAPAAARELDPHAHRSARPSTRNANVAGVPAREHRGPTVKRVATGPIGPRGGERRLDRLLVGDGRRRSTARRHRRCRTGRRRARRCRAPARTPGTAGDAWPRSVGAVRTASTAARDRAGAHLPRASSPAARAPLTLAVGRRAAILDGLGSSTGSGDRERGHEAELERRPPPRGRARWRYDPAARPARRRRRRASGPSARARPPSTSGSLRLPHFGDCTHDGQPFSHGHSPISRCASSTSASKARKPRRVIPIPPGWPS